MSRRRVHTGNQQRPSAAGAGPGAATWGGCGQEVQVTAAERSLPRRTALPPATVATLTLAGLFAANLLIVWALFLTSGEGKNPILTVAKFFGLHAALIMMLQLRPGGPAAVAGPADRHGPAHPLAPLGRLRPALDGGAARHLRHARLRRARPDVAAARRSRTWPAWPPRCSACCAAAHHRHGRGRVAAVRSGAGCRTRPGTRMHMLVYVAVAARARCTSCCEGTTFTATPLSAAYWWTLWALVARARWSPAGWCCRCGATPATGSGWPRSSRSRDNVVSVYVTGRRPRPAAGPRRPVLHLAVPRPQRLVAGQPVLAVGRARRPARCG